MAEHIALIVNGDPRELDVEPRRLLVQVLREDLDLTGTHIGCDTSQCGACTVHLDGKAVKSCTVFAVQADGSSVTTIEGLAPEGGMHPVQQAFWENHGLQCGFCTPGMIMTAADSSGATRSRSERRSGTRSRATCRCTGYHNIVEVGEGGGRGLPRFRDGLRGAADDHGTCSAQSGQARRGPSLITGEGRYLDDIKLQSMAHMAILRSPYAHANIRSVDVERGQGDGGRRGRLRRRRHPVQPAADGLAGGW